MGVEFTGGIEVGGQKVGDPTPRRDDLPGQFFPLGNDFDRDLFTAAIKDKGYDVLWESAAFCPNRLMTTGMSPKDHPIDCNICDGSAWIYFNPTETRMLITSVSLQQNYYAQGGWSRGRVMVTAMPEYRFHMYDRITLRDGLARFSEIVRRQPGTSKDHAKYPPVCALYVTWVTRAGSLKVYKQDQDFLITSDGMFSWPDPENRPDDDTYYSVAYMYRPRYVVLELTHQHRESTIKGTHFEFPVAGVAQLDFLIRDESKDGPQISFEDPFNVR